MASSRAVVSAPKLSGSAEDYERTHVHGVYDEIAAHFSSTRYKPWPIISKFISSLPAGSIGLDLGCGNGKYMSLPIEEPSRIRTIGLDRSINLLQIAQKARKDTNDVVLGDAIQTPWRPGSFDYTISIATIHHLATHTRRVQAVETAIKSVAPNGGRILIYVWAIEQDDASKRVLPTKGPGLEEEASMGLDVLVPWVHNTTNPPEPSQGDQDAHIYKRYYHMFAKGELQTLARQAAGNLGLLISEEIPESPTSDGISIVQDGWERSNYYIELVRWGRR